MKSEGDMPEFDYSSGSMCLDFANTWGDRSDASKDRLTDFNALLDWALGAGAVNGRERADLAKKAHRESDKMSSAYRLAREFRDIVYRLASTVAGGEAPSEKDVASLNSILQNVPRQELCCGESCCEWEWPTDEPDLRQVLWPVIQSAADLLTSDDAGRIRECGAPDCTWLFIDQSRGGRRRWCDMRTCGNRAKARRYYDRHRRNT
jgi:predicted RNA-binding Zn ribbon-like protein